MVRQCFPDGSPRLGVNWRVGELCDPAQFLVPTDIAIRYQWRGNRREADVAYFSEIYRDHSVSFRFIDETASYYNFLRNLPDSSLGRS